jgi:hypothetical protein
MKSITPAFPDPPSLEQAAFSLQIQLSDNRPHLPPNPHLLYLIHPSLICHYAGHPIEARFHHETLLCMLPNFPSIKHFSNHTLI